MPGLAGESFYLPFLSGLLSLHLLQLAWLCLSSYSPRGLMLAVCTPPPGSCTVFYQQLEQRYLVDFSHPHSISTSLKVGITATTKGTTLEVDHSPSCVPFWICLCSIRLWLTWLSQEPVPNTLS